MKRESTIADKLTICLPKGNKPLVTQSMFTGVKSTSQRLLISDTNQQRLNLINRKFNLRLLEPREQTTKSSKTKNDTWQQISNDSSALAAMWGTWAVPLILTSKQKPRFGHNMEVDVMKRSKKMNDAIHT